MPSKHELWLQQFYLSNPIPQFLCCKSNFKQSTDSLPQFYRHAYSQVLRCMHSQGARCVTGTIVCVRAGAGVPQWWWWWWCVCVGINTTSDHILGHQHHV